jgi:hypothetical protein
MSGFSPETESRSRRFSSTPKQSLPNAPTSRSSCSPATARPATKHPAFGHPASLLRPPAGSRRTLANCLNFGQPNTTNGPQCQVSRHKRRPVTTVFEHATHASTGASQRRRVTRAPGAAPPLTTAHPINSRPLSRSKCVPRTSTTPNTKPNHPPEIILGSPGIPSCTSRSRCSRILARPATTHPARGREVGFLTKTQGRPLRFSVQAPGSYGNS